MFGRSEKRRIMPWLAVAVGSLAVIGAASIVCRGRSWLRSGKRKIENMFSSSCEAEGCECE